jgi:hypothetical protein
VCKTDAWLGAKAGLLLGYPEFASSFLTKSHLSAFSFSNLVSLTSLYHTEQAVVVKLLGEEISVRLLSEELHACGSADLVSAVSFLARVSGSSKALKKAGSELIRRIELYTLSPHSMVSILETFSGLPPSPIHPLLLQAAQAFLLEHERFKTLSRNELAVVLHAMALSEIENIILSREIVKFLIEKECLPLENDPRTELRILSAVSLLKSFFPAAYLRQLSCKISDSIKSLDDQSILLTAFLNLAASSVCRHSLNSLILRISVEKLDLQDSACFFLLQVLAQQAPTEQQGCLIPAPAAGKGNNFIYPDAMEITEKANAAFPRSDPQKAKRLMKRIQQRFDSLFDTPDLVWSNRNTKKCPYDCSQAAGVNKTASMLKTITRCEE